MITPSPDFVSTDLATLRVRRTGTGPPVVLWHSLFIDSTSWGSIVDDLAASRTVYVIDGPSHGKSSAVNRDFTFDECVTAAVQALDGLGLTGPVDWIGNAWGGHVGIRLALRHPDRIHTLTTIGTPAHGLRPDERWTKVWPLVNVYRVFGPTALFLKPLSDALVGPEAVAVQPDRAAEVMSAFTRADRQAMFHAMRSMMVNRPDMSGDMARLSIPVLIIAARTDSTGWQPADARKVADTMADARVAEAAGSGHSTPLLIDSDRVLTLITEFWVSATGRRGAGRGRPDLR